jgi:hypothetical protein
MISSFLSRDPLEEFAVSLRRQGWTVTQALTYKTDSRILKVNNAASPRQAPNQLYEFLAKKTVRKLLRAIISGPQTRERLLRICLDEQELDRILADFEVDGFAERIGEEWTRGSACAGIDSMGPTLEWLVAEWFRSRLLCPAQHGVCIAEVPRGGDLDVVAMVNNVRVWVECKTKKPQDLTEEELRWYLQRAHDFNPEMAVLLIDTNSSIEEPINVLNHICAEVKWKQQALAGPASNEQRRIQLETFGRRHKKELWWGEGNRFVTNVVHSIEASLMAVLRLYHNEIRHSSSPGGLPEYTFDYVAGTVTKREE